jgi:acyl phosphate:glycerol-3-phosphate acyltransferase
MMIPFLFVVVVVIGYLLGSIPFGLFIGRIFAKKDVRQVGSGKIGMTNVLRTAGRTAAALSLVLDIIKGAIAVGIASLIFMGKKDMAGLFTPMETAKVLAALAALAGHVWPVFLRFKGGRGVATFFGGLTALSLPAAIVGGACVLGIGLRTKYMSLGSIIGAVIAFILLLTMFILQINIIFPYPPFEYVVYSMIGAVFIYIMHRDNIMRLFAGTERRIGEKGKANPPAGSTKEQAR